MQRIYSNLQGFVRVDSQRNETSPGGVGRSLAWKKPFPAEHEEGVRGIIDARQQLHAETRRAVGVHVVVVDAVDVIGVVVVLMLSWS